MGSNMIDERVKMKGGHTADQRNRLGCSLLAAVPECIRKCSEHCSTHGRCDACQEHKSTVSAAPASACDDDAHAVTLPLHRLLQYGHLGRLLRHAIRRR